MELLGLFGSRSVQHNVLLSHIVLSNCHENLQITKNLYNKLL
jgi:hypothetical protein